MDSTGVPHKINRHVYKAVNHLDKDACNFSNIYNYVKVCTRNLKPVPHLKETIQKSLDNLKASGVVKLDARNRYKLKTKYPTLKDVQNNEFGESSSNENFLTHTRKHKRHQSDTDDDEYDEELESEPKYFKTSSRNVSGTRVQVRKLPKHRKYNIRNKQSENSIKERQSANRSKASVIYKKSNSVPSGININHKSLSDNNLNNNECEKRKSKEHIYDLGTEQDEKTIDNDNDNDNDNENKDTESITSKPGTSHHSIDFEDVQNEPGEQVPDLNETNNNNQQGAEGSPLGNIRRYNFNYLN